MTDAIIDPPERPTLTDGRVLLRPLSSADRDALYAAVEESKAEVGRWMEWCKADYALKDAEEWIAHSVTSWASATGERTFGIFDAASVEFLGNCGLNQFNRVHHFANLGYWIRTSRARRGFATAATRLLARYAFECAGLARIEILVQVPNVASRRVAEKARLHARGDRAQPARVPGPALRRGALFPGARRPIGRWITSPICKATDIATPTAKPQPIDFLDS